MRLPALLLAALLAASPAAAQFGGRAVVAPPGTTAEQIDFWFDQLANAADADAAARVELELQRLWLQSGSPTADLLMAWAMDAFDAEDNNHALDLLDGVIALVPDFPEAWHRRAIVRFTLGDYPGAIADIEQTLIREPRHFGALAGLGQIFVRVGDEARAIDALNAALAINPFMAGTRDLAEQLDQQRGRNI